jgi:hypothetical protein
MGRPLLLHPHRAFSWNAAIVLSAALIFASMLASRLVKEQLKKP